MHSCTHARFKVPADGNVLERVSLSDGRASSDVTGCKRGRVADSALPHLPLAYRLVKPHLNPFLGACSMEVES